MKARCWFEEEPRVDFIRNIAPWDADDLDADRSRGLRLDPERPLIKVLLMAASGRLLPFSVHHIRNRLVVIFGHLPMPQINRSIRPLVSC